MRTIPYSSLERGLAAIAGIDSDNLLTHEKVQFAEYINDATVRMGALPLARDSTG